MFFNKHFKKILNILLLVVIFVSLTCYYFIQCKSSMSIIEGKSPRKIKRRIRREKRRAKGRIRRLVRPLRKIRRIMKRSRRRRRRRRNPTTSSQSQTNTVTTQATTKARTARTARTQPTVSNQKETAAKQAAQEAAKKKAEEEAAKAREAAAKEAAKRAATETAIVAAQRKAAEEKKKAEEAARRRAEAEKKKAEAARKAAEAARKRAEAEKKEAEEAARAEAARKAAEEEEARRIAEAERARKAAQEAEQRRLEENKKVQEEIYGQLKTGVSGTNISNCAVLYDTNLQLGKNKGLFNIFGNNDILRCNKDGNPEFVPAKQEEINDKGFVIINQNKNNTSGHIMYGDTISLCGKNYMIGGKDSTEKVQYGDNILITSNDTGTQFNATVNPNVYSLSNVKNLKSNDFKNEYVTNYEYCGNSGSGGGMSAR